MNDAPHPVLSAVGVSKSYGKATVLHDFSRSIRPGTVHGLLGPNGSGKTTCLHILTGLSPATAGSVAVAGEPIEHKRSRVLLGFAPDDLPLPLMLTGQEYLAFHDRLRGRDDREQARTLAEMFNVLEDLPRLIGEYSHGMKRKLQLVAATMHRPQLLVLDEPFRGLDPASAEGLRNLIRQFALSGRSVLIATHDMLRAERDCDEVDVLHKGVVVARGAPSDLVASTRGTVDLEGVFLSATGRQAPDKNLRTLERMFPSTVSEVA